MKKFFYLILLSIVVTSCYTTKDLNYIQSEDPDKEVNTFFNKRVIYEVQPNDLLSIKVQSLDPEQSAFFNINASPGANFGGGGQQQASLFLNSYSVDEEGFINLPIVGRLKVSSLSVEEVQELIQKEINKYLIDAIVLVKFVSYKISILGDVSNPGTYWIYSTQANIFEVLSMAGDLNISANRAQVRLIRQIEDSGYIINLDLTDPEIMESPYYYLLPNDVIYVEISKEATFRQNLPLLGTLFSAISTTVLLLNFLDKN